VEAIWNKTPAASWSFQRDSLTWLWRAHLRHIRTTETLILCHRKPKNTTRCVAAAPRKTITTRINIQPLSNNLIKTQIKRILRHLSLPKLISRKMFRTEITLLCSVTLVQINFTNSNSSKKVDITESIQASKTTSQDKRITRLSMKMNRLS
jgi:hypothetical protein